MVFMPPIFFSSWSIMPRMVKLTDPPQFFHWCANTLVLKETRIRHPKIFHFGMLTILN